MEASPQFNGSHGNGHRSKVRVGNCASSLVKGVEFYKDAPEDEVIPGLMRVNLGGYPFRSIEYSAAFAINEAKAGCEFSGAIFSGPNNAIKPSSVLNKGVAVHRGLRRT